MDNLGTGREFQGIRGTHFGNHWRRKAQLETARGDQHLGDAFQELSLRMLIIKRVGVPRYVTEMPLQVSERRTRNWTQPCWLTWDRVPYSKNNTIKQQSAVSSLLMFGRHGFSIPGCSTGRKYTEMFRGAARPKVVSGHGHCRSHPCEFIS